MSAKICMTADQESAQKEYFCGKINTFKMSLKDYSQVCHWMEKYFDGNLIKIL